MILSLDEYRDKQKIFVDLAVSGEVMSMDGAEDHVKLELHEHLEQLLGFRVNSSDIHFLWSFDTQKMVDTVTAFWHPIHLTVLLSGGVKDHQSVVLGPKDDRVSFPVLCPVDWSAGTEMPVLMNRVETYEWTGYETSLHARVFTLKP